MSQDPLASQVPLNARRPSGGSNEEMADPIKRKPSLFGGHDSTVKQAVMVQMAIVSLPIIVGIMLTTWTLPAWQQLPYGTVTITRTGIPTVLGLVLGIIFYLLKAEKIDGSDYIAIVKVLGVPIGITLGGLLWSWGKFLEFQLYQKSNIVSYYPGKKVKKPIQKVIGEGKDKRIEEEIIPVTVEERKADPYLADPVYLTFGANPPSDTLLDSWNTKLNGTGVQFLSTKTSSASLPATPNQKDTSRAEDLLRLGLLDRQVAAQIKWTVIWEITDAPVFDRIFRTQEDGEDQIKVQMTAIFNALGQSVALGWFMHNLEPMRKLCEVLLTAQLKNLRPDQPSVGCRIIEVLIDSQGLSHGMNTAIKDRAAADIEAGKTVRQAQSDAEGILERGNAETEVLRKRAEELKVSGSEAMRTKAGSEAASKVGQINIFDNNSGSTGIVDLLAERMLAGKAPEETSK